MLANHNVLALLGLMVCIGSPAQAQDMFVRPTNQAAHPVDLGIAAKPVTPTQPTGQPAPHVATSPTLQQAPQQAPQQPQQRQIPTQTVQPATSMPQPASQQPSFPPLQPDGTVDIIKVNDTPVSIPPGSGPYTFSIAMQPAAIGQMEVNEIYKHLGLSPQEIVQNCTYESMVILSMGEKNGAALSMGRTTTAQHKFTDALTGVDVVPTLACKIVKPPISGSIIEQGGYYKIGATNISCPVPRSGSVALNFKYLGNGRGDCQYK